MMMSMMSMMMRGDDDMMMIWWWMTSFFQNSPLLIRWRWKSLQTFKTPLKTGCKRNFGKIIKSIDSSRRLRAKCQIHVRFMSGLSQIYVRIWSGWILQMSGSVGFRPVRTPVFLHVNYCTTLSSIYSETVLDTAWETRIVFYNYVVYL